MPTLRHLEKFLATKKRSRPLFITASMIFFFVAFDGTLMYLAPIAMQKSGIQAGTMGLILGLSSVAGMIFDVALSRLLVNATYRTMFFLMLLTATTYPFFLFGANTITMYLIAMAIWGLYYNFYNIGTIDYVEHITTSEQYTSYFGVLKVFDSLGNLIAPFLGSILLIYASTQGAMLMWVLAILVPAFIFYFVLYVSRLTPPQKETETKLNVYKLLAEWKIWNRVGHILFPVLLLTLTINIIDSSIWTIGPLFSESLTSAGHFGGGAFMIAYTLPPILVGWIVGHFVSRFGKKKTALTALLCGSILLTLISVIQSPLALLAVMFGTSFCFALAWPTISSAYADDIRTEPEYSKEIETVEDWFTNLGDTIGPIAGGFAAQYLGLAQAFGVIGIFGIFTSLILIFNTPKTLMAGSRIENS